jgi:hypothetical protein
MPYSYEEMMKWRGMDEKMWAHYCEVEKTVMDVGKGEECNWCGLNEQDEAIKRSQKEDIRQWFKEG